MKDLEESELCFPQLNNSCRKNQHPHVEATLIYILLSCITLLTIVLNLLVIISISHFRQLHTPTNLLLLSLSVTDFLSGVLMMPIEIFLYQGCWTLGEFFCGVNCFLGFLIVSVSVGNMVLISVDRYVAICDPMFYSTKVTLNRVKHCVCLCWVFSAFHSSWILRDFLKQPFIYSSCYGECVVIVSYVVAAFDFVGTFSAPVVVIIVLYIRVFVVAVSQARSVHSHNAQGAVQRSKTMTAKRSEIKAARTLGVVVVVFILCSCPYYCFTFAIENNLLEGLSAIPQIWLLYLNSCLNPVIYVFFYPWFRKSIKLIVTLQTLSHGSNDVAIV